MNRMTLLQEPRSVTYLSLHMRSRKDATFQLTSKATEGTGLVII